MVARGGKEKGAGLLLCCGSLLSPGYLGQAGLEESHCYPCYPCSLTVQSGHHLCHPGFAGPHRHLSHHPDRPVAEGKRGDCSQAGTVVPACQSGWEKQSCELPLA